MITGLQLALAGGALFGLGVAMLIWRFSPADPDLDDALALLAPDRPRTDTTGALPPGGALEDRLGIWAIKTFPPSAWARTPVRELAIQEIPIHRFYGQKILYAVLGLAIPPLLSAFFSLMGLNLPFFIPTAASLGLAGFMFFMPDLTVRERATETRAEFSRALIAYIDLVALERNSGSGTRQAMEVAAEIGDSRPFKRISQELARSRWSGQAPWDALRALSEELGVPELDEFADIMRLSGEQGSQVYAHLRARSAAMRDALLKDELARANAIGERMSIPMSLLGVIFMAILVAPALLRVMAGGST